MKKRIAVMVLLLALSLLAGCAGKGSNEAYVQSVGMICGMGATTRVDRFAGVVEAKSETKIKKDEDKTVSEVKVRAGDAVKKDQVLFTYDQEQIKINLEKAELELEQLKNTVSSKKSEASALEKERAAADASSKLSYTLEIQELNAEITETNYSISAKEKEIEKIRESLNSLEVKSPIDGQVQSINETAGVDGTGGDQPFITIMETGAFRVKGYINEANRAILSEGMSVLVRSRTDDTVQSGDVTKIDLQAPTKSASSGYYSDSGDDDTVTSNKYPFYVELKDTEHFILGQHVYIEPDYGQDSGDDGQLNLPAYYIVDVDASPYVWAQNKNKKLEKRELTLGDYNEETDTYAVAAGLSAEDYIAFPEEGLSEGMACVEYDDAVYTDGDDAVNLLDGGDNSMAPEDDDV